MQYQIRCYLDRLLYISSEFIKINACLIMHCSVDQRSLLNQGIKIHATGPKSIASHFQSLTLSACYWSKHFSFPPIRFVRNQNYFIVDAHNLWFTFWAMILINIDHVLYLWLGDKVHASLPIFFIQVCHQDEFLISTNTILLLHRNLVFVVWVT